MNKIQITTKTAVPNITVPIGSTRELAPSEILAADSTDYLLGGTLTLRNGRIDKYQFEEGYCQAVRSTFNPSQDGFTFYYYDRDHLGSVRQVIEAEGTDQGTIVQKMNYYPSGLQFCNNVTDSDVQPNRYNGKELDKMHGLNTYDYGARQYNPVVGRWDRMDPLCEKYYGVSPYAYCHGDPINKIDPDGLDDYYTQNGVFIRSDDKKTNYVYVGKNQLMIKGKPITGKDFQNKASTIYAESSIGYGIADYKEMCAIASVHLRNNKAFGQESELAKSFRATALDKQNKNMQMANAALINALQGGKDYSNGATQWDGAEQAMVPSKYMDAPSNGHFMFKMNTMGWSMSDEHYSSWKEAVEKKFGKGKFTVPQTKKATTNYGGMKNKGRIRLQSTAQYGLTIFWKEVK